MTGATEIEIATRETTIFATRQGSGPPLLLLHGFPETHAMWRDVAPRLAERFSVVCADLRGYGRSGCPPSAPDHAPYAKRAMGQDMIQVMDHFGFGRFGVCGHDRGGRVAYRMALDHPDRIARLAVLDIIPTEDAFARADARLALGFWPWSLLAQPEPLPERLLAAGAEAVIDDAASQWGSASDAFPAAIRAGYAAVLRQADHARAICEEYRAAATLDRAHDCADRAAGRRIGCPVLALWGAGGAVETWYPEGPLAIWRSWADDVAGAGVEGGHFFPEARPGETAARLAAFFA